MMPMLKNIVLPSLLVVSVGACGSPDSSGESGPICQNIEFQNVDFDYRGIDQVYIAPGGSDTGNCRDSGAPCKTFEYATGQMVAGDGLILKDGFYTLADNGSLETRKRNGTPVPRSGSLPSGISFSRPTVARAENPGQVFIEGGLRIGNDSAKYQYIVVHGLTFHQGGAIQNGKFIAIKDSGFETGFGLGSIKHNMGNQCNYITDSWAWGKNMRTAVRVYRSNNNVLRRILIRHDGCDLPNCGESNPNASPGITVYNANNNVLENILVLDRSLGTTAVGYADFSTAQHDSNQPPQPGGELLAKNQWLGSMSINSEDTAMIFEADAVGSGTTATIRDFVALKTQGGVRLDPAHRAFNGISKFVVDGVHVYPEAGSTPHFLIGCDVVNGSDPGCNHSVSGVTEGPYMPATGLAATWLPQKRYGTDQDLWPWPNEARIKSEICEVEFTPISRGVCGTGQTITQYAFSF